MTARIARPISSRLAASSALRLDRPCVSAQASVSSPLAERDGRATSRCAASSGRSAWIDSMTAGHSSAKRVEVEPDGGHAPARSAPAGSIDGDGGDGRLAARRAA